MNTPFRTKTEERLAMIQKKEQQMRDDVASARKERSERTGRLRALRLAKEAEEQEPEVTPTKKKKAAPMPQAYRTAS